MKTTALRSFSLSAFILAIFAGLVSAQIPQTNNQTVTPEVQKTQEAVAKILEDSGRFFREGLQAYKENRRGDAGEHFDRSVEVFLYSTINVQRDQKLSSCYNQLIETVYRVEFPTDAQQPRVRELSATCSWAWNANDFKLADDVVAMARSSKNTPANSTTVVATTGGTAQQTPPTVGFTEQQFEPSPLDELAKLELTPEEQQIDTPAAQQQFQYIQYAVANKSLGFTFQVHPMIQQFINYYQGRGRSTMEIGLYRSGMFMSMARRIFREEGIPENMAWLGQVESTWKPTALSWAAASGLWQFIPGTGARFGLQRTAYVDERNSFDEATRASARYLKFLAARYNGNWELAMAAYSSGEGNVDRAIRRSGSMNFWSSYQYLPQETRNYVPNILATILIANNPRQYGFGHIQPAAPLRYDRVKVPASTNLSIIAQAADTTIQYLRYLNPHLRSNTTPPEPYIVNVPPTKANEVVAVFKRANATKINTSNLATTQTGETWQTISNRTGISVSDLVAANPGMKEPKGKVFVPMNSNRVATIAYTRPSSQSTTAPASNLKVVKAQAGDTVAKLATRNNADPTEVAKFNGLLPNSVLGAGREIKIPNK